jgi:hypothetical protein
MPASLLPPLLTTLLSLVVSGAHYSLAFPPSTSKTRKAPSYAKASEGKHSDKPHAREAQGVRGVNKTRIAQRAPTQKLRRAEFQKPQGLRCKLPSFLPPFRGNTLFPPEGTWAAAQTLHLP